VLAVVVPTEPDRELSETCAEVEECSPPQRSGEDGTDAPLLPRDVTL